MDITHKILSILRSGRNVILVGPSDSGKTWFAQNELIPFLKNNGIKTLYFENCNRLSAETTKDADLVVVDEVEMLQDLNFLETIHPKEKPYFSPQYVYQTKKWFDNLNSISQLGVFIVTREKEVLQNFIQNVRTLDWNAKAAGVIEFVVPRPKK